MGRLQRRITKQIRAAMDAAWKPHSYFDIVRASTCSEQTLSMNIFTCLLHILANEHGVHNRITDKNTINPLIFDSFPSQCPIGRMHGKNMTFGRSVIRKQWLPKWDIPGHPGNFHHGPMAGISANRGNMTCASLGQLISCLIKMTRFCQGIPMFIMFIVCCWNLRGPVWRKGYPQIQWFFLLITFKKKHSILFTDRSCE